MQIIKELSKEKRELSNTIEADEFQTFKNSNSEIIRICNYAKEMHEKNRISICI